MARQGSALKTAGIWIGGLILLILIAHTLLVSATQARVDAEIALIRSRGEPVTMKDLAAPKVPDTRNAAVVYEQAFRLMGTPPMQSAISCVQGFDCATAGSAEWSGLAKAVAVLKPLRALAEEAQRRPVCVFEKDWSRWQDVYFPENSHIRSLAKYLAADAMVSAHAEQMSEAARALELAYRMDGALEDGQMIICHLVRASVAAICHDALRACLAEGSFDRASLVRLSEAIHKIDPRPGFVRAMRGERVDGMWMFHHMRVWASDEYCTLGGYPTIYEDNYLLRPLRNLDEAAYLRLMRRAIGTAGMTRREMASRGLHPVDERDFPRYATLAACLTTLDSRICGAMDKMLAQLALAQAVIALEVYGCRFAGYPASLEEAEQELRRGIPKDPYSGQSLIYARTRTGFRLYSLGQDMDNDGGLDPEPAGLDPSRDGDMVWEWDANQGWIAPGPPPQPPPPPPTSGPLSPLAGPGP